MARILFQACRSQVRRYLAKSMAYMLLSIEPSVRSRLLNFLWVKTLPSPREHNRKLVASPHWFWSLEQLHQALVRSSLSVFGVTYWLCCTSKPSLYCHGPSCRCLVYLHFSTGTGVHGRMHWANVQISTGQYVVMNASLMSVGYIVACPPSVRAPFFTFNHSLVGIQAQVRLTSIFPLYFTILKARDTILYRSLLMNYKYSATWNVGCE